DAGAGPLAGDRERLAGAERARGDQALARDVAVPELRGGGFLHAVAERALDVADRGHHLRELRRLERGLVVRAGKVAVEREVLFDDRGAARDGRDGDVDPGRVVGIADGNAE